MPYSMERKGITKVAAMAIGRGSKPMLCAATLAAGVLAATPFAHAANTYTVIALGFLSGGSYSSAKGINDSSQVVGDATTTTGVSNNGNPHAFLYNSDATNRTMHDLGTLSGGIYSDANGINDSGQVVGRSEATASGNFHAILYNSAATNPTMQNLGTLRGGNDSVANGINASGQVVGWSNGTTINGKEYGHAFLYNSDAPNSTMQDLGALGGSSSSSYAYGINASGQVVGGSYTASGSYHAFLDSGPTMQDLGTLSGETTSIAYGINSSGQVVGASGTVSSSHGFLYNSATKTMHDLGTLGGSYSYATGINDSGQVVGYSFIANNYTSHAFLYSNGTMSDLNNLIPGYPKWTLYQALAINTNGDIVGYGFDRAGGDEQAFLLTPIVTPEPASLALLALGGLGLLLKRRRTMAATA